jgi:Methylamine utilization protein MauJ
MWFPYSLPTTWKRESDREPANDSFADRERRTFLVGFQLRNPVSREWSVELQLREPCCARQQDAGGEAISVGYYPDEHERLAEISCKLEDISAQNAVRRSYGLVSKILSYWAVTYGRGFAVGGLRIADLKHDARWRVVPHWPSAQAFNVPILETLPESFWQVASLYREARISPNDRYRFLCCDTILRMCARGDAPFDSDANAKRGSRAERVTQELMVLSGMVKFRPEFEGTALAELPNRLEDWRRSSLEFMLEGRATPETENLDCILEFTAVANLVDLAAHQILAQEIERCRVPRSRPVRRRSGERR